MIKYVPILKWKAGERVAITQLSKNQIEKIFPVIELIDSITEPELLKQINETGLKYAFIDILYSEDADFNFCKDLINDSKKINIKLIPVFYINDLFNDCSIIDQYNEVCIRLEIPEPIDSLNYNNFFEKLFKKSHTKIDFILDLTFVEDGQTATLKNIALNQTLSQLEKYLANINKLIISSTSFPDKLDDLTAGESKKYKRYELTIFNKVYNLPEYKNFINKLLYSDYGVNKFTNTEMNFSKLQYGVLPKVKYTTEDFYYVQKGKKNRISNTYIISVFDMCNKIIHSKFFYGKDFSYGDEQIYNKAIENKKPGGNKDWVTISTIHHIAVILKQLSN